MEQVYPEKSPASDAPKTSKPVAIRPQPGPQEQFLSTPADIAIYGGAAGGGKTFALLLEPLRHVRNSSFGAVIFRRNSTEILQEGGIWDSSESIYPLLGGSGARSRTEWNFPSRARIKFSHLEDDNARFAWQGAQIPFIGFDELTTFSESQFFYLLSRNRSDCGIRPYVRATCNPDPDSWVLKFIDWWIDPETGFAIKERGGKIRWFVRSGDELVFADTREELVERFGQETEPKSLTFIPASVFDNQILLRNDPGYLANLKMQSRVDRERLLNGNWRVRATAGSFFRREWFEAVGAAPVTNNVVRYWDQAGSENKGDWTVGLRLSRTPNGIFFVEEVVRGQWSSAKVEQVILQTAKRDGAHMRICLEQDPGQAGKAQANYLIRQLAGFNVSASPVTKDKQTRAKPAASQAEAGNVKIVRGRWNEAFLNELENFPEARHDDQVDAFSGALNMLAQARRIFVA